MKFQERAERNKVGFEDKCFLWHYVRIRMAERQDEREESKKGEGKLDDTEVRGERMLEKILIDQRNRG